ncbi:MAG: hypothetical protein ACK5RO_13285 [Pseudobdellovibrionaceae bacterium]|jgi:hypothetical protein
MKYFEDTMNIKKGALSAFLILGATIFWGCQSTDKKAESEPRKGWPADMASLQQSIEVLLPLAADQKKFADPKNTQLIDRELANLARVSKSVEHSPSMVVRDPSVQFISSALTEDLEKTVDSWRSGKLEYARFSVMNVTSYCIECHTRTSTGPDLKSETLRQSLQALPSIERAEYLLASRQFDAALEVLEKILKDSSTMQGDFMLVDKAIRYSLAISVKFKRDPKKSLQLVRLVLENEKAPFYLKQNAQSWKMAIEVWSKEKARSRQTAGDILATVRDLLRKADETTSSSMDKGGDIYYLRALSELHLLMTQQLPPQQIGETLYLTGVSYEAVKDLSIWTLHENYFESCIRTVPKTDWAKKCYKRLEESIYFGYTGSSGTNIPADVQMRLQSLQKLAF